jgi:hypothetical protein
MKRPFLHYLMPWRRSGAGSGPGAPMSCEEVGKVLQEYLDDHLDPGRSERLAAHLEECRRCGLEAETYQHIKESLAARREPASDDSLARLRAFGERIARGEEQVER